MGIFDRIKNISIHLKPCPKCGEDELKGGFRKEAVTCEACGHETTFSNIRKHSTVGGHNYNGGYIEGLIQSAEGETVTEDVLRTIGSSDRCVMDYLDDNEQPHHIIQGKTIDVEGGGDNSSILGNDRSRKMSFGRNRCLTVITDQRVFVVVQQGTGSDERHIPYDSITGMDLDIGAGGKTSRLTLQTHGRTYHMSGSLSDESYCRDAIEYVRHRRNERNGKDTAGSEKQNEALDKLERLKKLRDEGALTESEFNSKKSELLDKI